MTQKSFLKKEGFTLIELAIVLVVIGLLVGLGTSLIGPLTKQTKVVESREVVKAAKAAVLGNVVKNGYLPANLEAAGARKLDAWGNELLFYRAVDFDTSGENACGTTTTTLGGQPFQVYECTDDACSSPFIKSNIGFVVLSKGTDANEAGTDPGKDAVPPFYVRIQDSTYTDGGTTYNYDDIVQYVTLDEIRYAMGCLGDPRIPNAPTFIVGQGANRATLSSINLTWTAPTLNTDGSNLIDLAGYEIERSIDGATYSLLQSIGLGISFTDTSCTAGQRYFYRMRTVDKAGNKSATYSAVSSTTVSPIQQTVITTFPATANNVACPGTTANFPGTCGTNSRKALFTIRNNGNAADNGATVTVTNMTISWALVGGPGAGTVRKIAAPDGTNLYCNATGIAMGVTTAVTSLVLAAGATQTMGIYFCASTAITTANSAITIRFNTADGQIGLW